MEPAYVDSRGPLTIAMDSQGEVLLYDTETGDAMTLREDQLADLGRLAIAAHVKAGQLKINRPRPPAMLALGA